MRTLENRPFKIAYFPVPKVASTSMKHAFYQLEHGKAFDEADRPGHPANIHESFFSTRTFYKIDHARYADYTRIAIIRDPAQRILSAYRHRVAGMGELGEGRIDMDLARALGVRADPTREEFLCNLEAYRILSKSIRHHTDPFTKYLGHDLSYFTDVVKLHRLGRLAAQISALTGQRFELGHHQKGRDTPPGMRMRPKMRSALLSYCAGDYALMKGYFSIPKALQ